MAELPATSFAELRTQRLRRPTVLWQGPAAAAAGFDPDQVYCVPRPYEAPDGYDPQSRVEAVDRYGGAGTAGAGGSGRCSRHGALQTKGVGPTALVDPRADRHHASGTLTLVEAGLEVLFAAAYRQCLPFGAVPVHAAVLTGGVYQPHYAHDAQARCLRTLLVRPFVLRPAHFMRNLFHPPGLAAAGPHAPGWCADAWRTRGAMAVLAPALQQALALEGDAADEHGLIDRGLRELTRRWAWQAAAAFAHRLPHGTLSPSNIALSGAYLDFGLSNHVPSYRRLAWPPVWHDPWAELQAPLDTLTVLRHQVVKYHPAVGEDRLLPVDEIERLYHRTLRRRLGIEMARMGGLTEALALACPAALLDAWLGSMRAIWAQGAQERFVQWSGRMDDGQQTPPPRTAGQRDLSAVLASAGGIAEATQLDARLQPLLPEASLREAFVRAGCAVQQHLRQQAGDEAPWLASFLARQAQRKNGPLTGLRRDRNASHTGLLACEAAGDAAAATRLLTRVLEQARQVLSDLDPSLPGDDAATQWRAQAAEARHRGPSSVPPAG